MKGPYRSPWRWPAAALLLVTAGVHVPLVREHLAEAPYAGVLFLALVVVSVVLAGGLLVRDTALCWTLCGLVTALALVGFLVSRTVGLPELSDDIGNWTEPLSFPALAAELLTTAIAVMVLRGRAAQE